MKFLILAAVMLSAVCVAQPQGRPPPPPFEEVAAAMALTSAQIEPVKKILTRAHAQRRALRDASRDEHERLRAQTDAELARLLTPEQLTALEALRKTHRPPRKHRRNQYPSPPS